MIICDEHIHSKKLVEIKKKLVEINKKVRNFVRVRKKVRKYGNN